MSYCVILCHTVSYCVIDHHVETATRHLPSSEPVPKTGARTTTPGTGPHIHTCTHSLSLSQKVALPTDLHIHKLKRSTLSRPPQSSHNPSTIDIQGDVPIDPALFPVISLGQYGVTTDSDSEGGSETARNESEATGNRSEAIRKASM